MKLLNKARFWLAFLGGKAFLTCYFRQGRVRNDRPGMVSMRLYGGFLRYIAKPPLTIVVTGTNGKTTVAGMAAQILKAQGMTVSYNDWGANHHAGVARCLLDAVTWGNRPRVDAAVIELDELIAPEDMPDLKPDYILVTNVARDSMLRNGHPQYILQRLEKAIAGAPGAVVIVNGDDPISCTLAEGRRRLVFGAGNLELEEHTTLADDFPVCLRCGGKPRYLYRNNRHMGQVVCPDCGFSSPPRDILVEQVDISGKTLRIREGKDTFVYPLVSGSVHNALNQAALVALFRDQGIGHAELARYFRAVHVPALRETRIRIRGVELVTQAAKGQNATAVSTVFRWVAQEPGQKEVVLLLDEVYDDPRKTETAAWIYDTDYEYLNHPGIRRIILGGARYLDHRLRLLLAGVPAEKLVCLPDPLDTADQVDFQGVDGIYILHDVNSVTRGKQVRDWIRERMEAAHV